MTLHVGKDVRFEVPDDWMDRSVIAFSPAAAKAGAPAPSFVLTREKLPPGQTLRTYAAKQVSVLAKTLREFSMKDNRDVTVDGVASTQSEFAWSSPTGRLLQRMTMTELDGDVLLLTASAPFAQSEKAKPIWDQILATVKFRPVPPVVPPPGSGSIPPPPPPSSTNLPYRDSWLPGSKRR